jgi:NADH-quinone oxidoreductase subunit F
MEHGEGRSEDLEILTMHTKMLGPGNTFCALAPGAMEPLQSALKYFREDFERHIHEHSCPWSENLRQEATAFGGASVNSQYPST